MTLLAIAHRAGNSLTALQAAARAGADVVEADVHSSRGRLEVRHSKALGPLPWLWDRQPWQLTPRSLPLLQLAELLEAMPGEAPLMLDLKGVGRVGPRTAEALHARLPGTPVLVCSRWWPSVDAFAAAPWASVVLSARTPRELALLQRRLRRDGTAHGVSLHRSLLSARAVAELRSQVEVVMTWAVDDLDALDEVVALGVNGIITNEVEVLRAVAAQR